MHRRHRMRIIAKERPFDAEKWQQLLSAFAYVLHEQRAHPEQQTPEAPEALADTAPADRDTPPGSAS